MMGAQSTYPVVLAICLGCFCGNVGQGEPHLSRTSDSALVRVLAARNIILHALDPEFQRAVKPLSSLSRVVGDEMSLAAICLCKELSCYHERVRALWGIRGLFEARGLYADVADFLYTKLALCEARMIRTGRTRGRQ